MKTNKKTSSVKFYRQLEDFVCSKGSVSVLQAVGAGISRLGSLARQLAGISTKVLSERSRKLVGINESFQRVLLS
jgi:DNA-binding HxlR family transcriptional regulator